VGLGVSCSADRQILGKITPSGVYLEQLETDPAKYLPEVDESRLGGSVVKVDLNQPMSQILSTLSRYPIKTRLSLTGTLVVARDIAHAKLKERIDRGEGLPDYMKNHIVYYAGPAKTPEGYASGSFGPTTAGRMDSYVDLFMQHGGSFISLAKGNRSKAVTDACKKHGGFYLGSIGGPAAVLAQNNIKKVSVLEYEEVTQQEDMIAFGWVLTKSRISWAWKLSGRSKWKTSPHSSSWTTKETTSSRSCSKKQSQNMTGARATVFVSGMPTHHINHKNIEEQ